MTGNLDRSFPGLREPVEIIRDKWGVTHICAKNEEDLFFAQGYVAAQDRLWQLYIWGMEHEGRLAEILGPAAFDRDRETRLLMFRGPFDDLEWTSYRASVTEKPILVKTRQILKSDGRLDRSSSSSVQPRNIAI